MIYVLDTHALNWYLAKSPRLSERARSCIRDESAELLIPAIALAEAKFLSDRKRVPLTWDEILRSLVSDPGCALVPADLGVIARLPSGLNIHDGLICATALMVAETRGQATVITRDRAIAASGLVQTIW